MQSERLTFKPRQRYRGLRSLPLALLLLVSATAMAAPPANTRDILRALGITAEQVARLDRGEIVTQEMSAATKKELALGVATYLSKPPPRLAAYFSKGELAEIDPDITATADVPPDAGVEAFAGFVFTPEQREEAEELLDAEAGEHFNLSTDEIRSFAALQKQLADADPATVTEKVTQQYRKILLQRLQAYRSHGLAGIARYARDGGSVDPAAELRTAANSSKVLARFFPDIYTAWLKYPAHLPSGIKERFYWLNRTVENRPTAILSHSIVQAPNNSALMLVRHFYVGHSYNSAQLVIGCLPYRDGSILFYAQRTSTDQITGFGSRLKRNIGREQMQEQMINRLQRLRIALQSL